MIRANAARCPISAQCGIPGVPRSAYYWMIEHPETERADPIAGVFCQIFVGRFGVSFSPFERLFLGRFGFGQSCGLSVIA